MKTKHAPKAKAKAAKPATKPAKTVAQRKPVAAKPTPTKLVSAKATTAAPVKPAPAKAGEKTSFMWKLLERKEAELKRRNGEREPYDAEYARFNSPRRRGA